MIVTVKLFASYKDLLGEESFARSLSRTDLEWLLTPPPSADD